MTSDTVSRVMRVPQGVLMAAASIGDDNFTRIEPAFVTRGVFPIAENIEHWRIVPRESPLALVLPFPGSSGITVASVSQALATGTDAQRLETKGLLRARCAQEARLVLCGGMLMSYLTTWALWSCDPDSGGRFLMTPAKVADLRGFRLIGEGRGATYGRPMTAFKHDLTDLMNCGVSETSELKARSVEPLIQLYEVVRGGTYYRHAGILVDTILMKAGGAGGFAQVPLQAIRLGANDARTVVGMAALWRPVAAATAWRGTLKELARQLGVFRPATLRAAGRNYWIEIARNIAHVADEGGLGHLFVEGVDPGAETSVVLTPSAELTDAYQRLRAARERARELTDGIAREAAIRNLRLPAQRREK